MTRDDIIKLAREAGFTVRKFGDKDQVMEGDNYHIQTDEIERFAALVAEHEREHGMKLLTDVLIDAAVKAEREACAKECEEMRPSKPEYDQRFYDGCTFSAAAIRARGQA